MSLHSQTAEMSPERLNNWPGRYEKLAAFTTAFLSAVIAKLQQQSPEACGNWLNIYCSILPLTDSKREYLTHTSNLSDAPAHSWEKNGQIFTSLLCEQEKKKGGRDSSARLTQLTPSSVCVSV